ncbi:CLUMA_CG004438, isoform A [Clunio marinus]|uniref:CLUMA_CG004438, isoform A n=1 Tax=Clunio marinus TaxID=568069 RepID=A0A1J1HT61_9DIPT|nr:CLUMA_CG004438, isoform A [Clunio marinus]
MIPRSCPSTKPHFNPITCKCECNIALISCFGVSRKCQCECPARECGINSHFALNPKTCQCECLLKKCESPLILDEKNCRCRVCDKGVNTAL